MSYPVQRFDQIFGKALYKHMLCMYVCKKNLPFLANKLYFALNLTTILLNDIEREIRDRINKF